MAQDYPRSYYAATRNTGPSFPRLEADIDVDVVIIGGGFTGVASAVELSERGLRVALLEAERIGWGATGRNGGQITGSLSGDAAMLKQFSRKLGRAAAEDFVWNLRWRGQEIIKGRVEKYGIACDLKHGHLHAAYKPSHVAELEATYKDILAHGMGGDVELVRGSALRDLVGTDVYCAGLHNRRNMHVHSLNLCLGEAEAAQRLGAQIFTDTKVLRIEDGPRPKVVTAHGSVRAAQVLLAGNGYHRLGQRKLGGLIFPATLGIVATAPLSEAQAKEILPTDIAVYDTRFVLDYYRLTADRRLLFGSGTNYTGGESKDIAAQIRPAIEKTFPQLKGIGIDYAWQGQDGITINRIPQLGRLASNVFYAQGYSGHGIATSHIVAEVMAKAMTGDTRDFDIFSSAWQWRLPVGRFLGNQMLALGMWYYQKLDAFR
jgi:glycine/D-amino acid oxidase-like deaminating enzyme